MDQQQGLFEHDDADAIARGDWFERFWALFPRVRRLDKAKARRAWIKARVTAADMATIERVLPIQAISPQWSEHPRFIPHPTTYINNRRWSDDPDAYAPAPPTADERRMATNVRMGGCPHEPTCDSWRTCETLIVARLRARGRGPQGRF